jgi:hypothetical protein
MGRIWDAWSSQTPWSRSLVQIEQSTRATGSSVLQTYRRYVYPRRAALLGRVRDAVTASAEATTPSSREGSTPRPASSSALRSAVADALRRAPLSSTLLPQLSLVASLLTEDATVRGFASNDP